MYNAPILSSAPLVNMNGYILCGCEDTRSPTDRQKAREKKGGRIFATSADFFLPRRIVVIKGFHSHRHPTNTGAKENVITWS